MSTLELVQDLLMKEFGLTREQLAPEVQLASVGVDSLGLIELMFQIEDCLGMTLAQDQPLTLVTINDLVGYVDHLVLPRPAARQPEVAEAAIPVA